MRLGLFDQVTPCHPIVHTIEFKWFLAVIRKGLIKQVLAELSPRIGNEGLHGTKNFLKIL